MQPAQLITAEQYESAKSIIQQYEKQNQPMKAQIEAIPAMLKSLSGRTFRALRSYLISKYNILYQLTIEQLAAMTKGEFKLIRGFGQKGLDQLNNLIVSYGYSPYQFSLRK